MLSYSHLGFSLICVAEIFSPEQGKRVDLDSFSFQTDESWPVLDSYHDMDPPKKSLHFWWQDARSCSCWRKRHQQSKETFSTQNNNGVFIHYCFLLYCVLQCRGSSPSERRGCLEGGRIVLFLGRKPPFQFFKNWNQHRLWAILSISLFKPIVRGTFVERDCYFGSVFDAQQGDWKSNLSTHEIDLLVEFHSQSKDALPNSLISPTWRPSSKGQPTRARTRGQLLFENRFLNFSKIEMDIGQGYLLPFTIGKQNKRLLLDEANALLFCFWNWETSHKFRWRP